MVKTLINNANAKKVTDQTNAGGTKFVEIATPLNYLSNFWRTL